MSIKMILMIKLSKVYVSFQQKCTVVHHLNNSSIVIYQDFVPNWKFFY